MSEHNVEGKERTKGDGAKLIGHEALHVEEKYRNLVPRPSTEEYDALKISLEQVGQRNPVIVDENGAVVDGHSRYQVLRELGREVNFRVRTFSSEEEKEAFVVESAILRRSLNTYQKIELAQPALEKERGRAQEREKSGKKNTPVSSRAKYANKNGRGEILQQRDGY